MVKVSWLLLSLLWAIAHPAVCQPIRPPQWVKTRELEDKESRGVWKVFEKEDTHLQPKLPQARVSQIPTQHKSHHENTTSEHKLPFRHYKRESVPNKAIVSVLVPVAPAAEPLRPEYSHANDKQYDTYGESKHIVAMKMDNDSEKEPVHPSPGGLKRPHIDPSSTFNLSSSHSISFFSYRISFPFLKFAPLPFPQLPLPGIFTTVMILLALVWIAIVTIGLVELGNYVWQRRRFARAVAETDQTIEEISSSSSALLAKIPLQVLDPEATSARHESSTEDESGLSSGSDTDSESEVDDYRIF